jgi:hypothetical protein
MAVHREPASSRPRCTRGGSSVAAVPVYLPPVPLGVNPTAVKKIQACPRLPGNTFQDQMWLRKTADNAERYNVTFA